MHRTMIQVLKVEHTYTMLQNMFYLQQCKPRDDACKYAHNTSISDMAAKHLVDFSPHYHNLQNP